ncbi:NADPH-dependent FMN reductase [Paenibacillus thermotolerans]|uniref:NADPH-dependent FMN reductase n=1 Tax=Paenibacillus thermotolerans TaxID=3027807 RepID=UPI0023679204|nr:MULTISPECIES: NADPH-dependent FMN reductase [unclassified Paenibacillus]
MKIAALVGSLRKESLNRQLAETIKDRFNGTFDLEIVDLAPLPMYNQDEEHNPPEPVHELKEKIREADGVLIITPEYNWSVPGVLKNALDWLSREDRVLIGKPVMIAGVSVGMLGTVRAQLHLRQILSSPGLQADMLPAAGNEILVNAAATKFSKGKLTDESTLSVVDQVVNRFVDFASKKARN